MLIEFSVGNYLSFKNIITFSMVSSTIREHKDTNVFQVLDKIKLLKSCAIYGANASGKSNLFKAMSFMKEFVESSSKESQAEEKINVECFRLSTETITKPSFFEIVIVQDKTKYRYGFEVTFEEVVSEWLFSATKNKEIKLFERNKDKFFINNRFVEGKDLETKTRNNALFLSVVAQFNGETSIKIVKWFKGFNIISGMHEKYKNRTQELIQEVSYFKDRVVEFMKIADLGIEDIEVKKEPFELELEIPKTLEDLKFIFSESEVNISTLHKKYDENNKFVSLEKFNIRKSESDGTQKLFSLLGPILDTLSFNKVLIIDEFDSRLHTLITQFIISLFNSNSKNPFNSQLIVNTHDTNLLNNTLFRRDQIWFTEKDKYGATDLYSLVEYNEVRSDAPYEKGYLLGKFGSIPYISHFHFTLDKENGDD